MQEAAMTALSSLTARPDAPAAEDPRTTTARRTMCALALGLAPVLLTIGSLLSVSTSDKAAQEVVDIAADRNRFFVANLLLALERRLWCRARSHSLTWCARRARPG